MRTRQLLPVVWLSAGIFLPQSAATSQDNPYYAVLKKLWPTSSFDTTGVSRRNIVAWEDTLARLVAESVLDRRMRVPQSERLAQQLPGGNLQTRVQQSTGVAGSSAQSDAAPSAMPLAAAGVSLSAAGGGNGSQTIAAITLNPLLLAAGGNDPGTVSGISRTMDASVLIPTGNTDGDGNGILDYFGVRLRINARSLSQGSELLGAANDAMNELIDNETAIRKAVKHELEKRPLDCEDCANSFLGRDRVEGCTLASSSDFARVRRNFVTTVRQARDKVDEWYWGLDVRYDKGDPTLGKTPGAAGNGLFAALSYGTTLIGTNSSRTSFRAFAGIRSFEQDDYTDSSRTDPNDTTKQRAVLVPGVSDMQIHAAAGVEYVQAGVGATGQPIALSAGLEFQYGKYDGETNDRLNSRYLVFRVACRIPVSDANSVSVSYVNPIWGSFKEATNLTWTWNLQLPTGE